ncbi:hypothetical protein BJY01DRAFT_254467 [Aspergillus pseudoustus]|uniref:C2H2-type domain-containing protein n=1 Tax=Aspergillus pseudoustus TaxID=1810923 RepID=A0ABR4IUM2_9EURO
MSSLDQIPDPTSGILKCSIPYKMCRDCRTKYALLEHTALAHQRCPGANIHQIIFARYLFDVEDFRQIERMRAKFEAHIKALGGPAIEPVMLGVRYGLDPAIPESAAVLGATMFVSILVGFPRPLIFLDENPRVISGILDDLVGGLPPQPPGTQWEVLRVCEGEHHALMRLEWLERAVKLSKEFPVGSGGREVMTWVL